MKYSDVRWVVIALLLIVCHQSWSQISLNVSAYGTSCGFRNGRVKVKTSPAGSYTYTLKSTGAISNSDSIYGIAAGLDTVVVTDVTDPTNYALAIFTINSSVNVQAIFVDTTSPTCGKNNGVIRCSAANGNQYICTFIKNGVAVQTSSATILSNAAPGDYVFAVVEANTGCTDTLRGIHLTDVSNRVILNSIDITPEKCYGDSAGRIKVNIAPCPTCVYKWTYSAANTTDSATKLRAGVYKVSINNGICSSFDTNIAVPGPTTKLKDSLRVTTDYCSQNKGKGVVTIKGGTRPFIYQWSHGSSTSDSSFSLPGDSSVRVIVIDSKGCRDTSSYIKVGNTGNIKVSLTKSDTTCNTEANGRLKALPLPTPSATDIYTYLWSDSSKLQTASRLTAGSYTVTVTNQGGCSATATGIVPTWIPALNLTARPVGVTKGQTVTIDLTTNVPYKAIAWSPYVFGSTNRTSISDTPSVSTNYSVILTYGDACQLSTAIAVSVTVDSVFISMPNVFTPNGDADNQYFKVIGRSILSSFQIWIYDRWGNKVFESTDADFIWNGNNQYDGNRPMNIGVYTYVIEYAGYGANDKTVSAGNVTLIR